MVVDLMIAVEACSMSACPAKEKYIGISTNKAGHLFWAMKVLGWRFLCLLCIADDFPRSGGRTLLRLRFEVLGFRGVGKRNSATFGWSAGRSRCMVSLLKDSARWCS